MVLFSRMITAHATDTPTKAPEPVSETARIERAVKSSSWIPRLSSRPLRSCSSSSVPSGISTEPEVARTVMSPSAASVAPSSTPATTLENSTDTETPAPTAAYAAPATVA